MDTMMQSIPIPDRKGLRDFALLVGGVLAVLFGLILPWLFERLKCTATSVSTKRCVKVVLILMPIVVWNEAIITLIGQKVGAPGITKAKMMVMINFYLLEHICTWIVITILLTFCIELLKAPFRDKITAPFRKILG